LTLTLTASRWWCSLRAWASARLKFQPAAADRLRPKPVTEPDKQSTFSSSLFYLCRTDIQINPDHIVCGPWKDLNNIPETDIDSFMFRQEEVWNFPPAKNPNLVAFIDAPIGKTITMGGLKVRVDLLARGIHFHIKQDEVICFYMPNNVFLAYCTLNDSWIINRDVGSTQTWCGAFICEPIFYAFRIVT
jgi:hypothetical protein